jgi:hypothetical protein
MLTISLRSIAISLLALFFALVAFEVPLPVAAICSAVIGLHTLTGICIYQRYLNSLAVSFYGYIVVGFTLGTTSSVLTALALRPILDPSIASLIPSLIILPLTLIKRKPLTNLSEPPSITELVGVVSIAFLYLAQDSNWPVSLFVAGLCILFWIAIRPKQTYLRILQAVVLFPVFLLNVITGFTSRAPYWDYLADDFRVFESLSHSIWNFGPQDEFGTLGTIGAQYHIATYAYSGLLDRLSGADTFIVLNRVLLVLTAILMSALVWAFIKSEGGKNIFINLGLAAMFPLFFDYSYSSPSYCFGLVIFFAAVYFWTDGKVDIKFGLRVAINILLTVSIVTSKVSNVPLVLAGLGLLAIYAKFTMQPWRVSAIVNFASTLVTTSIYFVFFLANSRTETQLNSMYFFGYARRIAGDLASIESDLMWVTAGLMYTSIYLVLPITALFFFSYRYWKLVTPLVVFSVSAVPIVVFFALLGGADASQYFVLSSLAILNISLLKTFSLLLPDLKLSNASNRFLIFFALSAALIGFLVTQSTRFVDGGTSSEVLFRSFLRSHWIILFIFFLVLFLFSKLNHSDIKKSKFVFFLLAELLCFALIEAHYLDRLNKGTELTSDQSAIAFGSSDEISTGKWLAENTDLLSIIGTNHLCNAPCTGATWFESDYQLLDDTYLFPPSPTNYGTFDFILSAYSERRFLIEGSRFLLVNGMPREEVRQRVNASLAFANEPTKTSLRTLKEFGVGYFVIDKQSTAKRDWGKMAPKLYENDTFVVLELL